MFSPVNYTPAAKLWDEFSEARLKTVYAEAARGYAEPKFFAGLSRGSPLDICEHIFILALLEMGVCLASPSGEIASLHVRYFDGISNFFSTVPPIKSARLIAAKHDLSRQEIEPKLRTQRFAPWKYEGHDNEAFKRVYPTEPSGDEFGPYGKMYFHSLPVFFDRATFTVATELPPWSDAITVKESEATLVRNFGGRSICVASEKLESKWTDLLDGSLLPYEPAHSESEARPRGRPQRYVLSRELWASMKHDRGNRSWTQTVDYIKKQTGENPKAKTLRDWAKSDGN